MEKEIHSEQLLPEDLIIEILQHLPVKSLLRFRCVSITWFNFIKSPAFINGHLQKQKTKDTMMMLMSRSERYESVSGYLVNSGPQGVSLILSFHDIDSPQLEKLWPNLIVPEFPDLNRSHWYQEPHILGSCDGLLCVVQLGSAYIFNPAMRQFKLLPHCPFIKPIISNPYANGYFELVSPDNFGFGIGSDGSFKVIQIQSITWEYGVSRIRNTVIKPYMYDSTTNSWTKIKGQKTLLTFSDSRSPKSELSFNGSCHWLIEPISEKQIPDGILSFEVITGTFKRVECPQTMKERNGNKSLMALNECLAIVGVSYLDPDSLEVWVMKEYGVKESWTNQFVIAPYSVQRPLLFWKNGESLLMDVNEEGPLLSCELRSGETDSFQFHGDQETLSAVIYRESLISVT